MGRQYKSYDEDFKKTLVNLYESGKGISELSREYGVGKSTIDSWIKKFKTITTRDHIRFLRINVYSIWIENKKYAMYNYIENIL